MEQLLNVLNTALAEMVSVNTLHDLEQFKSRYVGKQSTTTN